MAKGGPSPVIEWSSAGYSAYDPVSKRTWSAATLDEVAKHLSSGPVTVALSRRNVFVRTIRVPDLSRDEVSQILRVQASQIFPIPAADAAIDFQLTSDVSPEGRLAIVASTRSDNLARIRESLSGHGLSIARVLPVSIGSMLLAEDTGVSDGAVVQHDPEGLAIDIVQNGILRYSRVCPVPADSEALSAEVCRTFGIAKIPCKSIIAAGGLVLADADHSIETKSLEALGNPRHELQLDLEPADEVARREQARSTGRQRFALLACAAAVIAGVLVGWDRTEDFAKAKRIDASRRAEIKQIEDIRSALTSKASSSESVVLTLMRATRPAQQVTDVLATIAEKVPEGLWLTGINFERGKPLIFRGTSKTNESVTQLVSALEKTSRLREVRLVFANNATIETVPVVQFSISAEIEGDVPLIDQKEKRK